jgi:ethanolamine utilization protein EutM
MPDIKAIGILETKGFIPLVEGADAAVKSANVDIVEWRQIGSGFVSFIVEGEVAAVRSAREVAAETIIPRPVDELRTTFKK